MGFGFRWAQDIPESPSYSADPEGAAFAAWFDACYAAFTHHDVSYGGFAKYERILRAAHRLDDSHVGIAFDGDGRLMRLNLRDWWAQATALYLPGEEAAYDEREEVWHDSPHQTFLRQVYSARSANEHQLLAEKFSSSDPWHILPAECTLIARTLEAVSVEQLRAEDYHLPSYAHFLRFWQEAAQHGGCIVS